MIKLDKILIDKELKSDREAGFVFSYQKLSNRFINRLFNHYYIVELCENFYDSEPDFDDEEFKMYMDYGVVTKSLGDITGLSFWEMISNADEIGEKKEQFTFSKKPHTMSELKAAYDKVVQMYKDYELKRLTFNNWQEPYFEGNWGMSQRFVDNYGRRILKNIRSCPLSAKGRLFAGKNDGQIRIYFYGRDFLQLDYWFIFEKRKKRLR